MKSLSLSDLFSSRTSRSAGRKPSLRKCSRVVDARHRKVKSGTASIEQLEDRLALAVDAGFLTPELGPGEDWVTVIADNGSDIFMEMASTPSAPTGDLFIADNASFTNRSVIEGVDSRVENVYVYHGSRVSQNAFDPQDFDGDSSNNFGTVVGYPWLNGALTGGDLYHVLPSEGIDWTEAVQGVLDLNDGNASELVYFRNAIAAGTPYDGSPYTDLKIYQGPGTGQNLLYSTKSIGGADFPQLTFTFDNDNIFGVATGDEAVPTLALSYDADTEVRTATDPNQTFIFPQNMGAAVSASQSIQIFDPGQHRYVPGTLSGTLDVVFGPTSKVALSYQVQESGLVAAAGGDLPISFNNTVADVRNVDGDFGRFTWYDADGDGETVTLQVAADFNSGSGLMDVTFTIAEDDNNAARPFSTFTSFATLALRDIDVTDRADDPTGLLYDATPNDFTLYPGQDFSRGLYVELVNPDSRIAIESAIPSADVVSLGASVVHINAPVRATNAFRIPSGDNTNFGTTTEQVTVNATLASPSFDIRLANSPATSSIDRSRLVVSQTGSLSNLADVLQRPPVQIPPANQLFAEVIDGDVFIEGRVNAARQSYLISSPQLQPDSTLQLIGEYSGFRPYQFTTNSRITGIDTGLIEATTLAITLGNDTLVFPEADYEEPFVPSRAFSILDISTDVDRLRVQASDRVNDPLNQPFPYIVNVRENDDLFIDAVAASSLPITITAAGSLDLLATLESAGDVSLESAEQFVLGAPLMTQFGTIQLTAPEVVVQNSIRVLDNFQDERDVDISIEATSGDLIINDAITAINRVSLNQAGTGSVSGSARVIADIVEVIAEGDVGISTDASRVFVRSPGAVSVDERTYGIFEIRDASNVSLVANGFDQVVTGEQAGFGSAAPDGGVRAYTSPALFANIYDTDILTVSAPNGSIDVQHYGSGTLSVGDTAKIDAGTSIPMQAAGSVSLRSTLAEIDVYDAPTPTGNAASVRVRTTAALTAGEQIPGVGNYITPNFRYEPGSPGVVPARISNVRVTRENAAGKSYLEAVDDGDPVATEPNVDANFKYARELDRIDVTTLRQGDRILVANGAAGAGLSDPNIANGIYFVVKVTYPVDDTRYVELDLVRVSDFDTTEELSEKHYVRVTDGVANVGKVFTADGSERADGNSPAGFAAGVPVYTGWGDGGNANVEYSFANVFDNDAEDVPVSVVPVLSRTGYVAAEAVTTRPLIDLGGDSSLAATYNAGTISGEGFVLPEFDGVTLREQDLVLVRYGAGNGSGQIAPDSPGLYRVASVGNNVDEPWRLERYQGIDENGDGALDHFFTGLVAVSQGTLRSTRTGEMFEVRLGSLNFSPLRYQQVDEYVSAAAGVYDSVIHYRTNIGSDNPAAPIRYIVSTELGTNDSVGSFGRMLTLLQGNSATNSRTGETQDQSLEFNPTVSNIVLEQELPAIYKPIEISATDMVSIDGTQITMSAEGTPIRSGSTTTSVGPVRPSQNKVARRLYRPGLSANAKSVYGLEFIQGSDGSKIRNLGIGGFLNGAAVRVAGADNILFDQMTLGRAASGSRLPNEVGFEFEGPGVEHSTVVNSVVVNSVRAGVLLGTSAEQVHLVSSSIGLVGEGNAIGVQFASNSNVPSYLGAAPVASAAATLQLPAEIEAVNSDDTADLIVVQDAASEGLRVGMVLYDAANDIARTIVSVEYVPPATAADVVGSYRVKVENASAIGDVTDSGNLVAGETLTAQLGWLLESRSSDTGVPTNPGKVTRGDTEVVLPVGVNPGDIFLRQAFGGFGSSIRADSIVEKIETVDFGQASEKTVVTLSVPVLATGRALLRLGSPGRNQIVGNSDGIVLQSSSSRTVNSLVADSIYDGIRIEKTTAAGLHIIGDSQGTVPGDNPFDPTDPTAERTVVSDANVIILRNQLAGIRLSDDVFAAMGQIDGSSVTPDDPGDADRVADYSSIDSFLENSLRIRGNYIGFNPTTSQSVGNGVAGISNIVVDAGASSSDRDRIEFLLVGDTTPEDPAGTGVGNDDDVVAARLLSNEAGVATGLDQQFNAYGVGPASSSGGDTDRETTPPRRPIVRG